MLSRKKLQDLLFSCLKYALERHEGNLKSKTDEESAKGFVDC